MKKSPLLYDERFCRGFFSAGYLFLGFISFVTKILLPIMLAKAEGSIWLTYVTWDLWWLAYLGVGWKIQFPSKQTWIFSMLVALGDFFASVFKLIIFAKTSLWDFWKVSLFFNNFYSFALSFFLFFYLFSHSTRKEFGIESQN